MISAATLIQALTSFAGKRPVSSCKADSATARCEWRFSGLLAITRHRKSFVLPRMLNEVMLTARKRQDCLQGEDSAKH